MAKGQIYALFFLSLLCGNLAGASPSQLVLLANSDNPDSVALAHYYCEQRQVPTRNIIALPMSAKETITWPEFASSIYTPLVEALESKGLWNATISPITDEVGRKQTVVFDHDIAYLLICKGVPLRISELPVKGDAPKRKGTHVNRAAVDSELALLPQTDTKREGVIANPYFNKKEVGFMDKAKVLAVSRLDGPSFDIARRLVDDAIQVEGTGLTGRAYIDVGGPYQPGNDWISRVGDLLGQAGVDVSIDKKKALMGEAVRFDEPAWYFGWYSIHPKGLMASPKVFFVPGSVVFHLHSYSASTLRRADKFWVGPLLSKGAAATVGNVYEPYLGLTHRPDVLVEHLLAGKTLAMANLYSVPAMSWQNILIGDPLYRPFAAKLEEPVAASEYEVVEQANRMYLAGQHEGARQYLQKAFHERPGIALAYRLAQMFYNNSMRGQAKSALRFMASVRYLEHAQLGLCVEIADFLAKDLEDTALALAIYQNVLNCPHLTDEMAVVYMPKAIAVARSEGNMKLARQWDQVYHVLKATVKKPNNTSKKKK